MWEVKQNISFEFEKFLWMESSLFSRIILWKLTWKGTYRWLWFSIRTTLYITYISNPHLYFVFLYSCIENHSLDLDVKDNARNLHTHLHLVSHTFATFILNERLIFSSFLDVSQTVLFLLFLFHNFFLSSVAMLKRDHLLVPDFVAVSVLFFMFRVKADGQVWMCQWSSSVVCVDIRNLCSISYPLWGGLLKFFRLPYKYRGWRFELERRGKGHSLEHV